MALTIDQALIECFNMLNKNLLESVESFPENFSTMYQYLFLLDWWASQLTEYPASSVLKEVNYDLISSIIIGASGMYRNATSSLRSAIELGLGFLYFVDYNYYYLKWKNNSFDLKWSVLEKCVLTEEYLGLFIGDNFDISNSNLLSRTISVYRSCSEYLHGKYEFMHTISNTQIVFDITRFNRWCELYLDVARVINCFVSLRFNQFISLMPEDNLVILEDIWSTLDIKKL